MSDNTFKKVLVALDRTIMDGFILDYLSKFHEVYGIEEIIFLHSIKKIDISLDIAEYHDAAKSAMLEIQSEVSDTISSFDFKKIKTKILVEEGSPTDIILQLALKESIDLIVMGRKRSLEGSGIVSSHIGRKSPSSILFITQAINPSLKNILVPVDFSEHAKLALEAGISIEERSNANISLINIFDVPIGYYKMGKSFEEFAEIMEGHAKNDYKMFLKVNSIKKEYPCHFTVKRDQSKIDMVFEHAISKRSDLIIIGSQGRTNSSAILLGSFAEKMILKDSDVPVLIIKKEGENMTLLQALLSI